MNRLRFTLFALVALVLLLTIPVSAATEIAQGDLSGEGWTSSNYASATVGQLGYYSGTSWLIKNIEYTQGLKSVIHFDNATHPAGYSGTFGANTSITGHYEDCTFNVSQGGAGYRVGTGRVGYQRFWSGFPATEQAGYQYVEFDTWTGYSGRTGDWSLVVNFNTSNFSYSSPWVGQVTGQPTGYIIIPNAYQNEHCAGAYTINKESPFLNNYTATKPAGIGILGTVNKTPQGTAYGSRITIVDGITNAPITQENTINTVDFTFNVANHPTIKVCAFSSNGDWYNTSRLFNVTGTTPTPTSTPIVPGDYTLTLSSQYANPMGNITATISSVLDPSLADLVGIQYGYEDASGYHQIYTPGSQAYTLDFWKQGATNWYQYDAPQMDYSHSYGTSVPSSSIIQIPSVGTKTLKLYLTTGSQGFITKTDTLYIGQGMNLTDTRIQAMDGLNGGVLQAVSFAVKNLNTGVWTNRTEQTGLMVYTAPPGTMISVYANRAGFSEGQLLNKPVQSQYDYTVNLYRASAPATGYVNEFVTVQATGGGYLTGATITITNSTDGKVFTKTSPTNGGAVIFNLTASSLHTYTVVKSGYQTVSGSFTTPASGGSQYLDVRMSYGSVITTARTTAPIPTGSWTVNPSMTPANQGNLTGFWSPWINVFSKMGASSYEMPLLIAGLIICLCMAAGFGMGGVLGGEVAMGFGAIFCVALGLIPIWVVLAIIVLGFLFYGLKIGR